MTPDKKDSNIKYFELLGKWTYIVNNYFSKSSVIIYQLKDMLVYVSIIWWSNNFYQHVKPFQQIEWILGDNYLLITSYI